ncbi:MAG: hypothetical protein F2667_06000 [Actinobacteria bacterium]|uniref:Unannotated protein n=1 Tax=freshwater metagenome TaxID=449393 RepID=A0A6J6Q828_9ZZZZ|nr:hypothetical protein [Actinomycetota bacterium]
MSEAALQLDALPLAVRTRVVALVAEVLPDVVHLPPSLRRVAAFAPARRARLGGTAITEALRDDSLRERAAVQITAKRSAEVSALRLGSLADPLESAALDWLIRPEGWDSRLGPAVSEVVARTPEVTDPGREERLRERLEHAEQSIREIRASHRQQVEEYKAEVSLLRRKISELRQSDRSSGMEVQEALTVAVEARAQAEAVASAADKEVRRLRALVERYEAESGGERRAVRAEREEVTVRTRLLLDTIIDAASGLRRELALPPATGAPADRVEAELAAAAPSHTAPQPQVPVSPALLERYLAMPRSRLIVDGYNVSKSAWPSSSLETQRLRLMNSLAPVVARTGAETTIVFDAAESEARSPVTPPRGVKVVFSPRGVIADKVIGDLVDAEPAGRVVLVVTDDQQVLSRTGRAGARGVSSRTLIDLVTH